MCDYTGDQMIRGKSLQYTARPQLTLVKVKSALLTPGSTSKASLQAMVGMEVGVVVGFVI